MKAQYQQCISCHLAKPTNNYIFNFGVHWEDSMAKYMKEHINFGANTNVNTEITHVMLIQILSNEENTSQKLSHLVRIIQILTAVL